MSARKLTAGVTSVTESIFVADTSSTTGGGLSGLAHDTVGLVAEYRREGESDWTGITLASGTLGTWSSGGFVADGSDPGSYEVGIPDAVFAVGATWVVVRLRGVTNMLTVRLRYELDVIDYQDGTRAGLTALPAFTAGSASGLPTLDASGGVLTVDQDATLTAIYNVTQQIGSGDLTIANNSGVSDTGDITIYRGDSLTVELTAAEAIDDADQLWLTVKRRPDQDDTASLVMLSLSDGLIYLNGTASEDLDAAQTGTLTITDAVNRLIELSLSPDATAALPIVSGAVYDVQKLSSSGSIRTVGTGAFAVTADVTRTTGA